LELKKDTYKQKIIRHLYFSGAVSSTELSKLTHKSIPLTTKILIELIEEGIVVETGLAISSGGRRPQTYAMKPDCMYIITVAMDQLVTRIGMQDMNMDAVGEVLKADISLVNNPNALVQLISLLDSFILKSGISKDHILGIGIGMPGFIDVTKGTNHLLLKSDRDESITEIIEAEIGVPVLIDNDSSLIALAELKAGKARDKKNTMVVNIGWGVGLGIIVNGELFRGNNGYAGEFSHISIFSNGKLCSCGKSGCLETETSLLVVTQKAMEALKGGKISSIKLENLNIATPEISTQQIIEAALAGDRFAIELLSEAGYHIGRGISILIHLLNPELIIISGRGALAGKLWLTPMQQAINEHCIPRISENTQLVISSLGYQAELIGAAFLVMDNIEKLEIHNHMIKRQALSTA
jgi:predicted NBD/HSP70 family sugar kinase